MNRSINLFMFILFLVRLSLFIKAHLATLLYVHPTEWSNPMINPYATGGSFSQFKMMQKEMTETLAYGTNLRILSESFPMNTNMTGFRCFSKIFAFLFFGRKFQALEGLIKCLSITILH